MDRTLPGLGREKLGSTAQSLTAATEHTAPPSFSAPTLGPKSCTVRWKQRSGDPPSTPIPGATWKLPSEMACAPRTPTPNGTLQTRKLSLGGGQPQIQSRDWDQAPPAARKACFCPLLVPVLGCILGSTPPLQRSPAPPGSVQGSREGRQWVEPPTLLCGPQGQGQGRWALAWVNSQLLCQEGHFPGTGGGQALRPQGGVLMSN